MASIHETAEGLHSAGLMDKRTMSEFECLVPYTGAATEAQGNPRALAS